MNAKIKCTRCVDGIVGPVCRPREASIFCAECKGSTWAEVGNGVQRVLDQYTLELPAWAPALVSELYNVCERHHVAAMDLGYQDEARTSRASAEEELLRVLKWCAVAGAQRPEVARAALALGGWPAVRSLVAGG